jgi:hypothetical protein
VAAKAPTAIPTPAPSPVDERAIAAATGVQIAAMISGMEKGRKRVPPCGSLVVRNGDTFST